MDTQTSTDLQQRHGGAHNQTWLRWVWRWPCDVECNRLYSMHQGDNTQAIQLSACMSARLRLSQTHFVCQDAASEDRVDFLLPVRGRQRTQGSRTCCTIHETPSI